MQPVQAALLSNPSQVEVYVDSNTQMLNTQGLAPGSTLRFYGLVFNDNGTLRMDCAQVTDGVAFAPAANLNMQRKAGVAKSVRRASGGLQRVITTVTKSH